MATKTTKAELEKRLAAAEQAAAVNKRHMEAAKKESDKLREQDLEQRRQIAALKERERAGFELEKQFAKQRLRTQTLERVLRIIRDLIDVHIENTGMYAWLLPYLAVSAAAMWLGSGVLT